MASEVDIHQRLLSSESRHSARDIELVLSARSGWSASENSYYFNVIRFQDR